MRLCFDIDGVLCELRKPEQDYRDVAPKPGAQEKLRALRAAGHYIILFTARHSRTCGGNLGQILARQGLTTLQWLKEHNFEFDEIYFGKPHADIYIDDNGFRFTDWEALGACGENLPRSAESQLENQK